jgi:hypothetical protein
MVKIVKVTIPLTTNAKTDFAQWLPLVLLMSLLYSRSCLRRDDFQEPSRGKRDLLVRCFPFCDKGKLHRASARQFLNQAC